MAEGIQPREASDRLNIFMARFDDLWRKYVTYSGGEELFGLPVTEYPDLQRIRKELGLLQKLYGLYNDVLEKVGGYFDMIKSVAWRCVFCLLSPRHTDLMTGSVSWRSLS